MSVEILHKAACALISPDAAIECIATGFVLTEVEVWDSHCHLLTCEYATRRVTRTESDGTVTVLASYFRGRTEQPE